MKYINDNPSIRIYELPRNGTEMIRIRARDVKAGMVIAFMSDDGAITYNGRFYVTAQTDAKQNEDGISYFEFMS